MQRTIADVETFFTFDVAGEPVVVTHDKSGTLRAFSNGSDQLPSAPEDPLFFQCEHRRIGVKPRRQRFRGFQLRINV